MIITHEQTRKTLRLSTLLHVLADGREGCTACFTDFVLLGLECVYTRLARAYIVVGEKTRMGPILQISYYTPANGPVCTVTVQNTGYHHVVCIKCPSIHSSVFGDNIF